MAVAVSRYAIFNWVVQLTFAGNKTLAAGWKAHHDHTYFGVIRLEINVSRCHLVKSVVEDAKSSESES